LVGVAHTGLWTQGGLVSDSPLLGRLLWYELLTADMAAAEKFYTAVVGWTTAPFDGSPDPYSMWMRGGVPIGGVTAIPAELKVHGVPPHWGMYVGVPNLEEGARRVTDLGGGVLSPVIDIPTVGRMQTVRDPQGAAFSIYQPASPPRQAEASPEIGDVSWIELVTTDSAAAFTFYNTLFGWRATESMDMGPMGVYRMFGRHLGSLGGMMNKTAEMANVPAHWGVYFRVPDINAAKDRATANGAQILNGPMEVPGGDWIVNCMDPQGAAFSMHARKE
jgi:hypothetical protein